MCFFGYWYYLYFHSLSLSHLRSGDSLDGSVHSASFAEYDVDPDFHADVVNVHETVPAAAVDF